MPHPDREVVQRPGGRPGARPGRPPRGRGACRGPTGRGTGRSRRRAGPAPPRARPRGRPAPLSGRPSRITSAARAPRARSAAAVSAVRRRASAAGEAWPRCERSPSVTATSRSRAREAASIDISPPAPSTSSSGCAATMTALVTPASPASPAPGSVLSHGQAAQDRSSVPGASIGCGPAAPAHHAAPLLGHQLAEPRQVALRVMLAQVDGEVGDRAGVRLVVAERPGAQRPARPGQHVGGDRLGQRPHPQCPQRALAAQVAGVRVDLVRRLAERGPRRAQRDVDGAQVRQRVRADVTLGGGGQQRRGHAARPAVPAGRHPGAAVAEPRPARVPARRPDRLRRESRGSRRPACRCPPSRWRASCPRCGSRSSMATANSRAPSLGGRGDQGMRANPRPRAVLLRAVQHPGAAPPAGRHVRAGRVRRPHAPAAARPRSRPAELGQDRDRVGVPFTEPAQARGLPRRGRRTRPSAPRSRRSRAAGCRACPTRRPR